MKARAVRVSVHTLRHWRQGVLNVCLYRVKQTHGCALCNDGFTYVSQNCAIGLHQRCQGMRLVLLISHFYFLLQIHLARYQSFASASRGLGETDAELESLRLVWEMCMVQSRLDTLLAPSRQIINSINEK